MIVHEIMDGIHKFSVIRNHMDQHLLTIKIIEEDLEQLLTILPMATKEEDFKPHRVNHSVLSQKHQEPVDYLLTLPVI